MIKEYKLINSNGISIVIISYGGIIKEINTPSGNGKFENIVLGYKDNNEYLNDKYYMGAIIGRYANRIAKGSFKLSGTDVTLNQEIVVGDVTNLINNKNLICEVKNLSHLQIGTLMLEAQQILVVVVGTYYAMKK